MKLLGFNIARKDGIVHITRAAPSDLHSVSSWRNVMGYIRESFAGAWQQNVVIDRSPSTLLAFSAVYACVTGIASDIAKMRIKLTRNVDGIWEEIDGVHANDKLNSVLKLLRKPNSYQNRIQFVTGWILSKLLYGNTYVLKQRDSSENVVALYVLNPALVTPLVAEDGSVYYALTQDYLSELDEGKTVPASEIIHDRMPELWHPLIGVSPLYACAMSVTMGNKIQSNSTSFFANGSIPGGIITVPGDISQEIGDRLKAAWETNYGGANSGKVAVLADGMTFDVIRMQADQSQLIDQLKWTVSDVARTFHYPEFKLGGALPPYAGNMQVLSMSYYSDCLQAPIEAIELCLKEGLGLPVDVDAEFDLDNLLRMDSAALFDTINKGISAGFMTPNEGRHKANYGPVAGGDSCYLQQQNFSLEALAKRDALPDPFATAKPAAATPMPTPEPEPKPAESKEMTLDQLRSMRARVLAPMEA